MKSLIESKTILIVLKGAAQITTAAANMVLCQIHTTFTRLQGLRKYCLLSEDVVVIPYMENAISPSVSTKLIVQ